MSIMIQTQFDGGCHDRLWDVRVPSYRIEEDVVFYCLRFEDLLTGKLYAQDMRYRDIEALHLALRSHFRQLPSFPEKHFWRKTNRNPALIQQRRILLENYLHVVLNMPALRGHREVKRFANIIRGSTQPRRLTTLHTSPSPRTRSKTTVDPHMQAPSKQKLIGMMKQKTRKQVTVEIQ